MINFLEVINPEMPMDEYDLSHKIDYDYVINVYANDNIAFIIQKVLLDNNLDGIKYEYLTEQICNKVNTLRGGLNILDNRDITNLGGRVIFYREGKDQSYLIQIWRGNRYINID